MNKKESYIEVTSDKKIKFEENQTTFMLLNPKEYKIEKITVDGGVYTAKDKKRCDFAANYLDKTIFIELKGRGVKDAYEQIIATCNDAKFIINKNKFAVVVTKGRKNPKDTSTAQTLKKDLNGRGITCFYGNNLFEKAIDTFVKSKPAKG